MARLTVTTREGEKRDLEGQPGLSVMEIIRDAGFRPVQRDTLYRTYFLN